MKVINEQVICSGLRVRDKTFSLTSCSRIATDIISIYEYSNIINDCRIYPICSVCYNDSTFIAYFTKIAPIKSHFTLQILVCNNPSCKSGQLSCGSLLCYDCSIIIKQKLAK